MPQCGTGVGRREVTATTTMTYSQEGAEEGRWFWLLFLHLGFVLIFLFGNSYFRSYDNTMRFLTILDRDEDGVWVVECPSIPGCISQGATRDEAMANIREAIAACLEVRAEQGLPLTIETQQVEVTV